MKIHIEIYLAAQMLQREQGTFTTTELVERVRREFGDTRPGVQTHAAAHCVANAPLHTGVGYNYLLRLDHGRYRCFDAANDTPHPTRSGLRSSPPEGDIPYEDNLHPIPEAPDRTAFQPIGDFSWPINRAERCIQVRLLVPLLDRPWGRVWFLEKLKCRCSAEEAYGAEVFHLCFPLRDVFSADYYHCRGTPSLEDQFIAYYNTLFGLPKDFGIESLWRTAPGGEIRHPGAGGQAGWHDDFLRERVPDKTLLECTRNVRRMLGTEADALLLTANHVILVECKYRTEPSLEQYERHLMMGKTLAKRLSKAFHFGMVVDDERDPRFVQIAAPYMRWDEIWERLKDRA